MDARLPRVAFLATALILMGAGYRTPNFVVDAPTPEMSQQIGQAAEKYRREMAVEWTGSEMPNWAQPCPIKVRVGDQLGAGGATSFVFDHGEVFGWQMNIQGSLTRILDSVLPHEVTHTVFATHFRQPPPRWADEGACTTVEHASERSKQEKMLINFLQNGRGIAFSRMFAMKDYPQDVMPLYSQGYSLARYLIQQHGRQGFVEFVQDGLKSGDWSAATKQHYGYANLGTLQDSWLDWVRLGSPPVGQPANSAIGIASAAPGDEGRRPRPEPNLIYRAQSNDRPANDRRAGDPTQRITPASDAREWSGASSPRAAGNGDRDARSIAETTYPVSHYASANQRTMPAAVAEPNESTSKIVELAARDAPPRSELDTANARLDSAALAPPPGAHRVLLEWSRPAEPTQ